MSVLAANPPKCPACHVDMVSVAFEDVPMASVKEMVRYNRYQPLHPSFWYKCDLHEIYVHRLAIQGR